MFFNLPWLSRKKPRSLETKIREMNVLVNEFEDSMSDIHDPVRTRLHAALIACRNPQDLWFLRGKLFNLISKHHCEGIAHERVSRIDQKLRFFGIRFPGSPA